MKNSIAQGPSILLILLAASVSLTACGGSSGESVVIGMTDGDAGMSEVSGNGSAPVNPTAAQLNDDLQDDELSCSGEFDIADLLVTESDRQWSCDIDQGAGFTTVSMSRRGTIVFGGNDIRYWNRNLPLEQFTVASPSTGFSVIGDIESFNTVMSFSITSDAGLSETYDCVLTARETASL